MNLSLRTNEADVFADLDRFAAAIVKVAAPAAVYKLAKQARTAGLRKVAEVYVMSQSKFREFIEIRPDRAAEVIEITAKGKAFPVYLFNPRKVAGGTVATIKGKAIFFPNSFLATMPKTGHRGVYARGAYGGKSTKRPFAPTGQAIGRFLFGKTRLPINELLTFTPAQAWANPAVEQAMADRVQEQAPIVLAQEIRFAARGR